VTISRRKPQTRVQVGGPPVRAAPPQMTEADEPGRIGVQVPGSDEQPALRPRCKRLDRLTRDVRDRDLRERQVGSMRVGERRSHLGVVRGRVSPGLLDGDLIDVERADGPVAEQRGGDGEDARPAPDVEQARLAAELRPKLDEELEAEPRRRMPTRPERARGLDHDRDHVLRRSLPRRADPEGADPDGPVEVPPPLRPAARDLGLDGAREGRPNRRRSGLVGVPRQLDLFTSIPLLEAGRKEVDEGGARDLGLRRRDLDRDPPEPAQRKTLFSLSKKPSSSR
jgi:hypothetical protein